LSNNIPEIITNATIDKRRVLKLSSLYDVDDECGEFFLNKRKIMKELCHFRFVQLAKDIGVDYTPDTIYKTLSMLACVTYDILIKDEVVSRREIMFAVHAFNLGNIEAAALCLRCASEKLDFGEVRVMLDGSCTSDSFCKTHECEDVSFYIKPTITLRDNEKLSVPMKAARHDNPWYMAVVPRTKNLASACARVREHLGDVAKNYDFWYHADEETDSFSHINLAHKEAKIAVRMGFEVVELSYYSLGFAVDLLARLRAEYYGAKYGNMHLPYLSFGQRPALLLIREARRLQSKMFARVVALIAMSTYIPLPLLHAPLEITDDAIWEQIFDVDDSCFYGSFKSEIIHNFWLNPDAPLVHDATMLANCKLPCHARVAKRPVASDFKKFEKIVEKLSVLL
jgi:hypothetical protein